MASEFPRSRTARALAEETLATLLLQLGEHRHEVVVIGGLNPDLLTEEPPAPHLGTTDVDLLLEVGFVYDREDLNFGWLEKGLIAAGFQPAIRGAGWRWRRLTHRVPVVLELLCDAPDDPGQEMALPGCNQATAMNLSGPAPALTDARVVPLQHPDGEPGATIDARFAGLGGYLLAKSAAVVGRRLDKDYYDLAYVLLYNPDGPAGAARAVLNALPATPLANHEGDLRAALRMFERSDSAGSTIFAEQMQQAGAADAVEFLAQDAVGAAAEFLREFARLRAQP